VVEIFMVDETTTDPVGASNEQNTPAPQNGNIEPALQATTKADSVTLIKVGGARSIPLSAEMSSSNVPEPIILEEVITKRQLPQTGVVAPALPTPSTAAPTAPIPTPIEPRKQAPATVSETPAPAPILQQPPPPPASPPVTEVASMQPATLAEEKPLPLPAKSDSLDQDISNILKSVKLPERQNMKVIAEVTPPASESTSPLQEAIAKESTAAKQEVPAMVTPHEAERHASSVEAVHTLKNDLQDVVKDKKISVVHAVSLELDRRAHEEPVVQTGPVMQRSKRTVAIIFSVALLLLIGLAALWGVASVMNQKTGTPSIPTSSILFAEQSVVLPLDGRSPDDLKQTLGAARKSAATLGSITRVIPTIATSSSNGTLANRPATFAEFMHALGITPPQELLRALGNDFFFGIHTVDKNAPIIVVPVTSYDHAFAGMLTWEDSINTDLAPVFTAVPALTKDQNGLPVKRTFQDLVMRNYDVRALEDDNGQIQMYYSFPTQNILVLAESPYSFTEILSRLQASRQL
jgi:hypothetical protein